VPGGWIRSHVGADVVVFFTYLYETTTAESPKQPPAGDDLHPPLTTQALPGCARVSHVFRHADGLAYFTPEEQRLVETYHAPTGVGRVIGLGFDAAARGVGDRFRQRHGLGAEPYLLYMGRIEPGKGLDELIQSARGHRHRRPDAPRLVLVGQLGMDVPEGPWLSVVGPVDDDDRLDAVSGSLALVQPSRFESFSLSLIEAWQQERPGLVQRESPVLLGQARRSGGAIPYSRPSEFAAAVDLLLDEPGLAESLGASGARYVAANYRWEVVLDRYEALLHEATARRREAATKLRATSCDRTAGGADRFPR
jgi:glycosyltransferase involved in cell wall biosynthesis